MKTILIFFSIFFLNHMLGQELTFPIANASWVTNHISPCIGGTTYKYAWTEYLYGDTLIENKTYAKLILQKHCVYSNEGDHCQETYSYPESGDFAMGCILEENGKVIFKKFNVPDSLFEAYDRELKIVPPDEEIVFYDINWEVGDTVAYPRENNEALVFDITSIQELNGTKEFKLQLRNGHPWESFVAVEGMGGKMGLFNMYYPNQTAGEYLTVPVCFYLDGQLIQAGEYCTNPCMITNAYIPLNIDGTCIFPNPVTVNLYINLDCINATSGTIEIRNYLNMVLHEESFYNPHLDDIPLAIDLNDFTPGLYIITIFSKDKLVALKKFVVGE